MSEPSYRPGTIVAGKYRIERLLGEGGMGVVVKATHLLLEEPVALKFLLPSMVVRPEAITRFLREAKAALRIRSEHVARILDVGQLESGAPFMVMEYLEGHDLHEALELGPMSVEAAVGAVLQACVALDEAHRRGIIHRDIKPANLFLTADAAGRSLVKVLDFGISKLTDETSHALTSTSVAMGSAVYMSPEQLVSARDVDLRTDIYALGVTLYELLTAQFPYKGESMPQLVAAILKGMPVPIEQRRPDIPRELAEVIHRAFALAPEERHATAEALARALLPFATAEDGALVSRLGSAAIEGDRRSQPAVPAAPQAIAAPIAPPIAEAPVPRPSADTHILTEAGVTHSPRRDGGGRKALLAVVPLVGAIAAIAAVWAGSHDADPPPEDTPPAETAPAAAGMPSSAPTATEPPPPEDAAGGALPVASATASSSASAAQTPVRPHPPRRPKAATTPKPPPEPDIYGGRR